MVNPYQYQIGGSLANTDAPTYVSSEKLTIRNLPSLKKLANFVTSSTRDKWVNLPC
jgi:hypothetical protein